jgi:hypothetical protein
MVQTKPYTPPSGYFDLPYTYAFSAANLVNGNNYLNQYVYIQGGYGDFAVRRIVGMNRILAGGGTGLFQIMRASQGVYQSSAPIQAPNTPETAAVPEEWYPELGQIGFDLYGINLPNPANTAQIAFQGVRRQKGNNPLIGYKEDPKTFTYLSPIATLSQVASQNARIITYTPIDNYDFLLYQVMLFSAPGVGPGLEFRADIIQPDQESLKKLGPRAALPAFAPITSPICTVQIFDQNQVAISNEPILDIFYNGAAGTPYVNGAIVPPLMFRRNTQIEIDFYSQITNGADIPVQVQALLIGRKLYPCS